MKNELPIGVFDSGVGGLTVLSSLQKKLPNENFIYLGDTARVPYGTRSATTVIRYSMRVAGHLVQRKIKALVVACNTASSYALDELSKQCEPLGITVFGVIFPGALAASKQTNNMQIAVLGTDGTIDGRKYIEVLNELNPQLLITQQACPLFVPLIEEGWQDNPVCKMVAIEYIKSLTNVDTIILGCTHYPLLKSVLEEILPKVTFIDSAEATAQFVRDHLEEHCLLASRIEGESEYLVTDNLKRFHKVGYYFLGYHPSPLTLIDIQDSDELGVTT